MINERLDVVRSARIKTGLVSDIAGRQTNCGGDVLFIFTELFSEFFDAAEVCQGIYI